MLRKGSRLRHSSSPSLAVVFDANDEGWVSMEHVGQMLLEGLAADGRLRPSAHVRSLPRIARRLSRGHGAFNADRAAGRFVTYPLSLLRKRGAFDLFHVVDHSYAHLVHALPAARSGVYCHDLDAFRSITDPDWVRKPRWFRAMARLQLLGLQRASLVFHSTKTIRAELERLVPPERLVFAPYGVSPEFTPRGRSTEDKSNELLAPLRGARYLLHVGSSAARKRIDRVLEIFARVLRRHPEVWLVQQGAPLNETLRARANALGIEHRLLQPPFLNRETLAGLYRQAAAVYLPSDAEGFGLPVIEALACGAPVVASDLPTLREAGGDSALYCGTEDLQAWSEQLSKLLDAPTTAPPLEARLAHSSRFTWREHARIIADAYLRIFNAN